MNSTANSSSSMTRSMNGADKLARGLGWYSIGLGLVELVAPQVLTRTLGMEGREMWVRGCGMREIISGIGALSDNPVPAMWSRVGGDALDIAALTMVFHDDNPKKDNVGRAAALVMATSAIDLYCAQALQQRHRRPAGAVYDYTDRSGFTRPVAEMRGTASDFVVPANMRARPAMWAEYKARKGSMR